MPVGIYNTDPHDAGNALFTQIAQKEFSITALHLDNSLQKEIPSSQVLFLDLIDASHIDGSLQSCIAAPTIQSFHQAIDFGKKGHIQKTLTIDHSIQQATFRIKYIDWDSIIDTFHLGCSANAMSEKFKGIPTCVANNLAYIFPATHCIAPHGPCDPTNDERTNNHPYQCLECLISIYHKTLCAWDNFAVRPAQYDLELNASYLIARQNYKLDINATTFAHTLDSEYNTTLTGNSFVTSLIPKTGCKGSQDANITYHLLNSSLRFHQGTTTFDRYTFHDVGDVQLHLSDTQWTHIDQNKIAPDGTRYFDCIPNSAQNTPNDEGKIGCLIQAIKPLTFHPKKFSHSVSLENFSNALFTYFANDPQMFATLQLTITAQLADGSPAQNYIRSCYARDIRTKVRLIKNQQLQ